MGTPQAQRDFADFAVAFFCLLFFGEAAVNQNLK
jgi:hypothetical protein